MLIEANGIAGVRKGCAAIVVGPRLHLSRPVGRPRGAGAPSTSHPLGLALGEGTLRAFPLLHGACAMALSAIVAGPAAATDLPQYGARGDRSFREVCAPGTYLVGLQVRSGLWIDQVAIKCARVAPNGTTSGVTVSAAHGGDGGGPFRGQDQCAQGSIINGLNFSFTPNDRQVRQFWMVCRPAVGGGPTLVGVGNKADSLTPYRQECLPREVAVGLHGNSGRHLNAVGLICAREPIPTKPTEAEAAKMHRCAGYAGLAVAQAKEWADRQCAAPTPGRWSTNYRDHYGWCMSLVAGDKLPDHEASARRGPLSQCRTSNPLSGFRGQDAGGACTHSAVLKNDVCLESDGRPSAHWDSGSLTVPGCGGTAQQALANAKALFAQQSAMAERPIAGACTYTVQQVQGCLCR